jgi:fibronectin-binding autotransporter adhesin
VPNLKPNYNFSLLLVSGAMVFLSPDMGAQTREIFWGSHLGSEYLDQGDTTPGTIQSLFGLDAAGTNKASLVNGGADTSGDFTGDLIELGFFDTDGVGDSSYTPNTDISNPFKGIWTPLTSKTTIGRDWAGSGSDLVGAGEFYFKTKFTYSPSVVNESSNNYGETFVFTDNLGDASDPNDLTDRINALQGATSALLGIRFYDIDTSDASAGGGGTAKATDGSTRYNTIMHTGAGTDWIWSSGFISLHNVAGTATDPDLVFEFDNSSANAASKIGTGDNAIVSDDFTATVTYFDGSSNINVGDAGIGSSVFSGFDGSGTIYGGQDANIVTLHSQSGNTGADAYEFSGDFYRAATGTDSTDLTIIKTGAGDQILSGNLNLADSDDTSASGGLNIAAGNLILKPASGKTQVVEYLTGVQHGGVLTLDNSGVNDGTIVTLGFANQTSSTFSGAIVLDGNGAAGESTIKVSKARTDGGFVAADFADKQLLAASISENGGAKKLVKEGTGILQLTGVNTFTGGVTIEDGTLSVIGLNTLGDSSNTVTINKGKLELQTVVNSGYTINTGDAEKTMIGGEGAPTQAVTIGSANSSNFVDVISPGTGISSSLSNSSTQQQVSLGDRGYAIGTFTISNTLTLESGGVFDWEVSDFTGSAGTDWDLLKFDTLNFDTTSDTFTINIMGLAADGTAGAMAGGNVWGSYQTSSGFKFMEATGNGSGWTGTGALGQGTVSQFTVVDQGWSYYNSHHLHEWSVWYDGSGAFYLQYSAVPEPSTYMMVTGLLMVPGMSYLRRIRRKKGSDQEETSL